MSLTLPLLPPVWFWLAATSWALLCALALPRVPWRLLSGGGRELHVVLGATVAVALLWCLAGTPIAGLRIHLLGATALSLLMGAPLALLCGSLAVGISHLLWPHAAPLWPFECLFGIAIPVGITQLLLALVRRHGPRNPYVYWLGVGFLGGGIGMCAHLLAWLLLAWLAGGVAPQPVSWTALTILLMFPEAFLNGAAITSLAVFAPDWVRSFNLDDYTGRDPHT
jgi:uncharacterized membrane protein